MLLVIWILVFAAVAFLAYYLLQPREDIVRRRLLDTINLDGVGAAPGGSLAERRGHRLTDTLGRSFGRALPRGTLRNVERLLVQAGSPMPLTTFLGGWAVMVAVAIGVAFLLISRTNGAFLLIWGFLLAWLIALLPYFLLKRRATRRSRRIERALPDALDLLLTSVEAGLGIDAAFSLVAQRTHGPLAEEFTEYLRQVGLGRSRRDALNEIAERSGCPGLVRMAMIVTQAQETGTSIGDVLRYQAGELRAERRARAQEKAQRAPFWMTIPLILCFLPAMAAVVMVPSILNMIEFVGDLGGGLGP